MVVSGVLAWFRATIFPLVGSILGCIASFGAASYIQVTDWFSVMFTDTLFTWEFTNLYTGQILSLSTIPIPVLGDVIYYLVYYLTNICNVVVNALGLSHLPFALVFPIPILMFSIFVGLCKFFAGLVSDLIKIVVK